MNLHAKQTEQTIAFLANRPEVDAAYLHGSYAKGTMHPNSDVDIALLPAPGKTLSLRDRLECASQIEVFFGCPVDIGILSTGNLVYVKEVIDHGKELFCRNRFRTDLFLTTSLSMYSDLQQQRKEVLHAYSA